MKHNKIQKILALIIGISFSSFLIQATQSLESFDENFNSKIESFQKVISQQATDKEKLQAANFIKSLHNDLNISCNEYILVNPDSKNASLYNTTKELAAKLQIRTPFIFILKKNYPNAFAINKKKCSAIFLTECLLDILSENELKAVIAHELAHIKMDHLKKSKIIGLLTLAGCSAIGIGITIGLAYKYGKYINGEAAKLIIMLTTLAGGAAFILPQSRKDEKEADTLAGEITNPDDLASALQKITYPNKFLNLFTKELLDEYKQIIANGNVGLLKKWLYKIKIKSEELGLKLSELFEKINIFGTHPSTEERSKYLEEMKNPNSESDPDTNEDIIETA